MDELGPDELSLPPDKDTTQKGDGDLLNSLGNLQAEEGLNLDEEELFSGDILAEEEPVAPPQTTRYTPDSPTAKGRRNPRLNQQVRRGRDVEIIKQKLLLTRSSKAKRAILLGVKRIAKL